MHAATAFVHWELLILIFIIDHLTSIASCEVNILTRGEAIRSHVKIRCLAITTQCMQSRCVVEDLYIGTEYFSQNLLHTFCWNNSNGFRLHHFTFYLFKSFSRNTIRRRLLFDAMTCYTRGGLVVGRRTCDLVVAGSRPGRDVAA